MKIEALRLFNVRRFANRGVAIENIGDGVNVLCAANEFGKSTSFEALHALFFQSHAGAPRDVKRLQPYSGGNPLIEADIETDAGRYRLAKQFIGSRRATVTDLSTGRLIAQADEAESFISGLTRGGAGGPSGLLWVRQGITGIEDRDKSEREEERRVRASLLESVQGEVEAVTGGRRMAEIMEAVVEELGRLVTATGRPKSGGAYETALEERKRLAAEEARLDGEVRQLRQALDQRAEAAKRLAELERADEKRERRQAVENAEKAFERARAHGEALRAAEMEGTLARSRSDAARLAHTSYRDALAAHADLQNRLAEAEAIRQKAAEGRRMASEGFDRAFAEAEVAENEERDARALLSRIDAALRAREAAERYAAAAKRLAEAEELRQSIEASEAALALVAVPVKTVERLHSLELEIARLSAAEDARQPTLSMDYRAETTVRLSLDGTPMEPGSEHGFGALARLEIPGIGTLRLRSNRGSEADGRLVEARSERGRLLATLSVASLREATEREADAARRAAALDRLRARFDAIAPEGLPKLKAEVARLAVPLSQTGDPALELKADPDAVRQAVERAGERVAAARGALRGAQPARIRAEQALTEAQASLAILDSERSRVEAMLGPAAERPIRERDLADEAAKALAAASEAEAKVVALRDTAPDLQNAEAALRRARSVEEAAAKEANALREKLAALNENVRFHADEAVEERWRETADARAAADLRVKTLEREIAVLTHLQETLQAARSAARDLYLKPVMTELRPLLSLLFDDVSISFDEKTLLPHTITRAGAEEDVDRLSGGMREQLSILTRLAFARLLARDGRPAPVILDDALVYSDDDRIERMFDALHRQAREQQIIVFSCRQRAFSRLGGNVLSMTDWTPA